MHRGYVKFWRKTLDSGLLQNPHALQVFCYAISVAAIAPYKTVVNGKPFSVLPGQFVAGRKQLAERLGMSEQNVRTAIKFLESMEIITAAPTNTCTVFSVVNWATYQNQTNDCNQQANQRLTSDQPTANHSLKNIKNAKKEENGATRSLSPSVEDVAAFAKENGLVIDAQRFVDYHAARGWKTKSGQLLINWQAEARNWAKTEKPAQSADEYRPLAPVPDSYRADRIYDDKMPDWGAPKSSGGYVCRALARRGIC